MKVKAVIPSVKGIEFEAPNKITVPELKRIICEKLNIEYSLTQLLLDGSPLKDNEGLSVKNKAQIHLTVDYYWARSLILWGFEAQNIVRGSSALIAGAGALGCEVADNLAMLGVGRFTIVDFDQIELSNLNRMSPYELSDLGKTKANVLAYKLKKYPFLTVNPIEERLEEIPKSVFFNSDIILSCLDNLTSRVFLTSIAVKYSIPIVDAGIIGYQGRIQSYIPDQGACPSCIIPAYRYPQLAELRNPCTRNIDDEAMPSLVTSNKLIASIQSHEALKIILSLKGVENEVIGDPLKELIVIDLKYNKYSVIPIKKNDKCIVCGTDGIAGERSIKLEVSHENLNSPEKLLGQINVQGLDRNDYKVLLEDKSSFKRVEKDKWNEITKLSKGKYIYVIFYDNTTENYKEAVIKIIE